VQQINTYESLDLKEGNVIVFAMLVLWN